MKLTILNDVHIGVTRNAGTTPASQQALREYIRHRFEELLPKQGDLMILGDLFDTSNVPMLEVLETYKVLTSWLGASQAKLYNVAGNHDLSKTSSILSSFQFLGALLSMSHPERYVHIERPTLTPYGYVIPHLTNQQVFNAVLNGVSAVDRLFVHVNIDNQFAAQSDHSLNLSAEQIEKLPVQQIICAHEHHKRHLGKVVIPGNQVAGSVADWLGGQDKYMAVIENGNLDLVTTSRRADEYEEISWDSIPETTDTRFVRVVGQVPAESMSAVLSSINKLRLLSKSLIVSNATTVETADGNVVFSDSRETVNSFSLLGTLRKHLSPAEIQILESL